MINQDKKIKQTSLFVNKTTYLAEWHAVLIQLTQQQVTGHSKVNRNPLPKKNNH